ncbi:hypothetical protein BDW_09485 [Bdellovibrio bacteriovorus W]|nr:hypothetical protein BDW_09485 [Bdellovibrio bacteriovorus W]
MTSSLILAAGIISSSFFGSWHCAAMCGPIASLMREKKDLWKYHLSRGFSYTLLGALAGGVGSSFLGSHVEALRLSATVIMCFFLFAYGVQLLRNNTSPRFLNWHLPLKPFFKSGSPWVIGAMTALLPCGWLYTYVLAAVATQSAWSGAFVMSLFWLGGLPALNALPALVRRMVNQAGLRHQKIAGIVLIIASLYSGFAFFWHHNVH